MRRPSSASRAVITSRSASAPSVANQEPIQVEVRKGPGFSESAMSTSHSGASVRSRVRSMRSRSGAGWAGMIMRSPVVPGST